MGRMRADLAQKMHNPCGSLPPGVRSDAGAGRTEPSGEGPEGERKSRNET